MTPDLQSRNRRSHVLVIGGGASGVLFACHLLGDPTRKLTVTLIERRPEVGRGIAYVTADPNHLLNVRAANMSAFPDQPDHFWRWLCARETNGSARYRCPDPFCFVPRNIYGQYIESLLSPFLGDGENAACALRVVRGECVSIRQADSGVTILLNNGARAHGDVAVLAT